MQMKSDKFVCSGAFACLRRASIMMTKIKAHDKIYANHNKFRFNAKEQREITP